MNTHKKIKHAIALRDKKKQIVLQKLFIEFLWVGKKQKFGSVQKI